MSVSIRAISSRDDVSNPGNNLYVTGLSARVVEADLEELFSQEGKVKNSQDMRQSTVLAFFDMASQKKQEKVKIMLSIFVVENKYEI